VIVNPPNVHELETGKSGPGLRVVLYLRQSDKEQRLSIDQQRKECRAYAQSRGWVIVGEYIDDGKSGSKSVEKRHAWHRLIADAQQKGRAFDAVLCWDTSRFGRLDSLAGAEYKQRLRKAGVWLETTRGEKIDWSTSMGRLIDAMQSEANNQYALDISRNVIRGRRAVFDLGYFAKRLPYGYDRQYVEGGQVKLNVPRRDVFAKPRNWRLVPVPNADEAKIIKWMFEQWRERDMSFMGTLNALYERGIASPSGQPSWTLAQVKNVLTERAYVGDLVIGNGGRTKEVHNRIGERVKENAVAALVDRKTFDIVQRKVREREGAEWRPKTASGPLSGILKCGHCGHTLARKTTVNGGTRYICESATKRPHLGCSQWRVAESELLPVVCRELVEAVDFEVLRRLAAKPEKRDASELEKLRREEQRLRQMVERGAKNLLLADPENFAAAQDALSKLRRQHERLANALKLAEAGDGPDEAKRRLEWWQDVKGNLIKVADARSITIKPEETGRMLDPDQPEHLFTHPRDHRKPITYDAPPIYAQPDVLRSMLRRLNVEVHLWWQRYGEKGKRWKLTTGVLRAMFTPGAEASEKSLLALAARGATAAAGEGSATDAAKDADSDASDNPAHRAPRSAALPAPSRSPRSTR
jgi:site-specific DNA recombinase